MKSDCSFHNSPMWSAKGRLTRSVSRGIVKSGLQFGILIVGGEESHS